MRAIANIIVFDKLEHKRCHQAKQTQNIGYKLTGEKFKQVVVATYMKLI